MGFTTLFKVLKALALFLREIWLRDRTFRQFVNENMPLIFAYTGFLSMTILFGNLYLIVKDQEILIEEQTRIQTNLQRELDVNVPYLTEQVAWYKERYYELKSSRPATQVADKEPQAGPRQPRKPRPKQPPEEKQIVTRPPSNELVERWKRLSE